MKSGRPSLRFLLVIASVLVLSILDRPRQSTATGTVLNPCLLAGQVPSPGTKVLIFSRTASMDRATSTSKTVGWDEQVTLYAVMIRPGGEFISDGQIIEYEGRSIRTTPWTQEQSASLQIAWYKVEAASRGKYYSNTGPPWHWDEIDYAEVPLIQFRDRCSIEADVHPTILQDQFTEVPHGVGTMRFKVSITVADRTWSSPGADVRYKGGIGPDVHRISYRHNTAITVLDWAFSLFNLPYIWGSAKMRNTESSHQAEQYIGADCADFVTAAYRLAGHHNLHYGWSGSYDPNAAKSVTVFIAREPHLDGELYRTSRNREISFSNEGVRPGDIVLFNRHVGLLYKDTPPLGLLSRDDLIIHTLFKEPEIISISEAYHSPFSIVRLK